MLWLLVWTLLVLGAAGVFFLLGRGLWRRSKALVRELTALTDRLTEVGDRLDDLDRAAARGNAEFPPVEPAGDVRSGRRSPLQQR